MTKRPAFVRRVRFPKAKPIRIIPGKGKHKTEQRVFASDIHETFCVQKGCKFYGQHAVQGHCHTTKTWAGDSEDWTYIDALMGAGDTLMLEVRALHRRQKLTPAQRVTDLEHHLATAWTNVVSTSDVMVRQRRQIALLGKALASALRKLANARGKLNPRVGEES